MSRAFRGPILLLAIGLCLSGQAFASTTATITVNGAETTGDRNTITISFNGFSETVTYGQFSTSASIASAFGAMFSRDYLPVGLCANASGNAINFKLKGAATFGMLSVTDSNASFTLSSSGFLAAGSPASDTGTVTLTVNGTTAAIAHYGYGATPTIVAQSLADGVVSGSPVNVTAVNDAVYIESKTTGTGTDYSFSIQNTSYASTIFSRPSFPSSTISGDLGGGAAASTGSGATKVYSYTVPSSGYDSVGNLTNYSDCISGTTNCIMGAWNFTYDTLNRLVGGTPTAGSFVGQNLCWSYDAFGNRTAQDTQSAACPALPSVPTVTETYNTSNQFSSGLFSYDAAGDVTADSNSGNSYLYDGEGRICAVKSEPVNGTYTMTGYIYNAEGERVAKGSITSMSCNPAVNGFQTRNDYVVGLSGEQAAEMTVGNSGAMVWQHTNVFAAGTLVATYDNDGLHFYLNDPLGTRRVQTDPFGAVEQSCTNLPFGDQLSCTNSTQYPTEHHFAQRERDAESGNDFMLARYYNSSSGRFLSPDWSAVVEPVPYAKLGDPQTLNLYAYVGNNPMNRTDPTGHMSCGGEQHGFWWCVGHALGINETQKEYNERISIERQWLVDNVANSTGQKNALAGASANSIDGIYQKWNAAIAKAQCNSWTGCADGSPFPHPANDFARDATGALVLFRGGGYNVRFGVDVKVGQDGLLKPDGLGRPRGISVNEDPAKVSQFGEVTEVPSLPPDLQFTQIGKPGHWEITPRGPMTPGRYVELIEKLGEEAVEHPEE